MSFKIVPAVIKIEQAIIIKMFCNILIKIEVSIIYIIFIIDINEETKEHNKIKESFY